MDSWIYGLVLIALTLAIHAAGVTFLVSVLHNVLVRLESRNIRLAHVRAIVIGTITAMGVLLGVLHAIEGVVWAAAFWWLRGIGPLDAAILYSFDTMATRGASGLALQPHWQIMGPLEAADGMLLFGISAAFVFTVMQLFYQHLVFRERPDGSARPE